MSSFAADRSRALRIPRVSVLLPARNAAPTLPAALASLVRQTLTDWECVLVDDGSTDATPAIAEAFAARDARFRVVHRPPRGIVPALNDGLALCAAPLVARMDADDLAHRRRLELQARLLDSRPDLTAAGCHVRIFPRAATSPRLREYERWLNSLQTAEDVARDAYVECPVAHPTLMVRRDALHGGYRDVGWPEDYDLVLRLLQSGRPIAIVPHRLHFWRDDPRRLSRTDPRYAVARFTACKAHFLAEGFLRARGGYVLWGYGGTGRMLRRELAALGKNPSHIVEVKASRIGERIHGARVIPPAALRDLRPERIVVSVARAGPRAEIRAALGEMGFLEGSDYVCAA